MKRIKTGLLMLFWASVSVLCIIFMCAEIDASLEAFILVKASAMLLFWFSYRRIAKLDEYGSGE